MFIHNLIHLECVVNLVYGNKAKEKGGTQKAGQNTEETGAAARHRSHWPKTEANQSTGSSRRTIA